MTQSTIISKLVIGYIDGHQCYDDECTGCPKHTICLACDQVIFNDASHVMGCPDHPPCDSCGGYMELHGFDHKILCKYILPCSDCGAIWAYKKIHKITHRKHCKFRTSLKVIKRMNWNRQEIKRASEAVGYFFYALKSS